MQLQVALDRLTLDDAVRMATSVEQYADWIEVGTSLIKEFGMESVRRIRQAVPRARILADIKTNDEARYEFELCFASGADAATVMGAAPDATIEICLSAARQQGKQVLIDLLGTTTERQQALLKYRDAIFGVHVSKDVQESGAGSRISIASRLPDWAAEYQVAIAGGIGLDDIPELGARLPSLTVIVGSAITGAADAHSAARAFASAMAPYRQQKERV
ncbi:MAG TPA: orotidine 5'-phosphate decarboxylase / HUMPS family protein [Ktedonobacteraceae bacterium]|nr:orotidine 5'-phosphate decarboxylase / HUMPS family protein [Ktedonobacteraceae bacterium]